MTTAQPTRGRGSYTGFRATLKAVAVGPRGSRDLSFDEAREATAALLDGEVTPAQAGAFLIGLRFKGEAADELAGIAAALRERVAAIDIDAPQLIISAGAFDGVAEAPPLGLAASICAAAAGAEVAVACGSVLGPKHGTTPAAVLAALGGPVRPTLEQSAEMLARSRVCVVHAGAALPGWEELAEIRDEVGLRGPIHSAEKLIDWFGARRFVVGHTHGSFAAKLLGALARLGAERAIAVRGIEGSDLLRPGRPVAADSRGPLELPEHPGMHLRGDPDPDLAAALTRAVLGGSERGPARQAVVASAAVRLLAGLDSLAIGDALRRCEVALDSGAAAETLEALVG